MLAIQTYSAIFFSKIYQKKLQSKLLNSSTFYSFHLFIREFLRRLICYMILKHEIKRSNLFWLISQLEKHK